MPDKVTISDKATAIQALLTQFEAVEQEQLDIGEKMGSLLVAQIRCAEKCRVLRRAMEALVK